MCAKTSDTHSADDPVTAADDQDATPRLRALAREVRTALLDVVWRQWQVLDAGAAAPRASGMGGAGRDPIERDDLRSMVDPEALVLVSLGLLDEERRLGDLLHDWASRNSDLLSVQRIRNLLATYPDAPRRSLAAPLTWFARVARDRAKDARWRPLARSVHEAGADADAEPAVRAFGSQDRAAPTRKVRATRARLLSPSTLLLRLRLGIGVGIKADVLAFLLARRDRWTTVREATDAIGYSTAPERRALDDLVAARLVEAGHGQPASYHATFDTWAPLLGLREPPPAWASWHERFVFSVAFLAWERTTRGRSLTPYAFGAAGRELLETHRSAFEQDGIAQWSVRTPVEDWGAFVERSVRRLAERMRAMA
jgi:hypothetical protein